MNLTRRLLVGIGGLALMAAVMVGGSAAATVQAGSKVATIHFTAVLTPGTTTYAINSTSCTLTTPNGRTVACALNGAGTLGPNGNSPATGEWAITTTNGKVITLNLDHLNSCGTGSGVEVPASGSPFPVVATVPTLTTTGTTASGTIQVFDVGNRTVTC
ncbi:MAG TPA: hypothetical protein VHT30_08720 [Acidimicrobiales bacterium]|jgi:hypothetical protein|nr:hypothetical protein [Acidimicrobiales bacterium]